jgi:queuosine precursor transporter
MNELFFLLHVIIVAITALAALKLGKEALVGLIGILAILANLFVVKQTTLFGCNVTCGDVYIVGSIFALGLLQEYFGKKIAHKAIWIGFFMAVFYVIMSQMHLLYIPNKFDVMQKHFLPILKHMPRIIIASLVAHIVAQYVLVGLNTLFKNMSSCRYLVVRNTGALICSQAVDTILFGFIGLYGIVHSVVQVMFFSFIIQLIIIACTVPFIAIAKRWFKKTSFKKI